MKITLMLKDGKVAYFGKDKDACIKQTDSVRRKEVCNWGRYLQWLEDAGYTFREIPIEETLRELAVLRELGEVVEKESYCQVALFHPQSPSCAICDQRFRCAPLSKLRVLRTQPKDSPSGAKDSICFDEGHISIGIGDPCPPKALDIHGDIIEAKESEGKDG